jgi:hypothetical protein
VGRDDRYRIFFVHLDEGIQIAVVEGLGQQRVDLLGTVRGHRWPLPTEGCRSELWSANPRILAFATM